MEMFVTASLSSYRSFCFGNIGHWREDEVSISVQVQGGLPPHPRMAHMVSQKEIYLRHCFQLLLPFSKAIQGRDQGSSNPLPFLNRFLGNVHFIFSSI